MGVTGWMLFGVKYLGTQGMNEGEFIIWNILITAVFFGYRIYIITTGNRLLLGQITKRFKICGTCARNNKNTARKCKYCGDRTVGFFPVDSVYASTWMWLKNSYLINKVKEFNVENLETLTKIKDTKFWQKIQNFAFLDLNFIFWTSTSCSLLKRFFDAFMGRLVVIIADTNLGGKMPVNTKHMTHDADSNTLTVDDGITRREFSIDERHNPGISLPTEFQGTYRSNKLLVDELYRLDGVIPGRIFQGVEYHGEYIYSVFSNPREKYIYVYKHHMNTYSLKGSAKLYYPDWFEPKWFRLGWIASGIRMHVQSGSVFIGLTLFNGVDIGSKEFCWGYSNYLAKVTFSTQGDR